MAAFARRRWTVVAALLVALVIAGVVARGAIGSLVIAHGLAADDPRDYMLAYMTALRWGFPVDGDLVTDGAFLSSGLKVSKPSAIGLHGEFDHELQFFVTYDSVWRESTGAPSGRLSRFIYVGRDVGQRWRVIGGGTGP